MCSACLVGQTLQHFVCDLVNAHLSRVHLNPNNCKYGSTLLVHNVFMFVNVILHAKNSLHLVELSAQCSRVHDTLAHNDATNRFYCMKRVLFFFSLIDFHFFCRRDLFVVFNLQNQFQLLSSHWILCIIINYINSAVALFCTARFVRIYVIYTIPRSAAIIKLFEHQMTFLRTND